MEFNMSLTQDKENCSFSKVVRESHNSPLRTPLCDVRNKLSTSGYVHSIRKTLYGTPASSKRRTPLRGPSCRKTTPVSHEYTPKRLTSCKGKGKLLSDKRIKTVHFKLDNDTTTPPSTASVSLPTDAEEVLDREIEGFINSILKLTVDEIKAESQVIPVINIISPSPVSLHEDTPTTSEEVRKQYKTQFREGDLSLLPQTGSTVTEGCVDVVKTKTSKIPLSKSCRLSLEKCASLTVDSSTQVSPRLTRDSVNPEQSEKIVQVRPACQSLALSPIQWSTSSVEVMTVQQEMLDRSMGTEEICQMHQGVSVKPVCEDRTTMTDFSNTRTTDTSMTPVKVLSKTGKRLTAEEVRRQHPRAIANQLDTTLVCNEKLKIDLKHAERERDKLRGIVRELRASISQKNKQIEEGEALRDSEKSEMEEMHFSVVRDFQSKIEEKDKRLEILEGEVCSLKSLVMESEQEYHTFKCTLENKCWDLQSQLENQEKQHLQQVQELETDFEKNNYRSQFDRSQQCIRELQAQLDEFADIVADLEITGQLQGEFHSAMTETHTTLRHVGVRSAEMRKKLIHEYVAMQKDRKELKSNLQNYSQENEVLKEECENLAKSVEMLHDSMSQLQSLYAGTSNDLLQATSLVGHLNQELGGARKALQDLLLTKELLVQHLMEQREKDEESTKQIDNLSSQLEELNFQLLEEQKRREHSEKAALKEKTIHEEKTSMYEVSITNLERTLDYRDQDIDILEKDLYECREIIQEQRYKMDKMDNEYSSFKETVKVQETDKAELEALRGNVDFLEAERTMLIDTLRDSEEKIRTTFRQLNEQQMATIHAQSQFVQYDTTIKHFERQLARTSDKLENTLAEARSTQLQQESDLKDCSVAVIMLEEKMHSILAVLQKKVGMENEDADGESEGLQGSGVPSESLVSKVLRAVNSSTDTPAEKETSFSWSQSCPQSDETSLENTQSQSGSSRDSGISNSMNLTSPGEASRFKLGYSESSAFAPVRTRSVSRTPLKQGTAFELGEEPVALVNQISTLDTAFNQIVRLANVLEKASELSLQDIKGENTLLQGKVSQLESEVLRLQQDRQFRTEELTEANQLIEFLKTRIRDLGDKIIALTDCQAEQKSHKLSKEVERLLCQVKELESDKKLLEEQLAEVNSQSLEQGQQSDKHVHVQAEMRSLKRKNQQLMLQRMEERDRYQELKNKAARTIKILETNLEKAESEVIRFDDLVSSIQQIFEKHNEFISLNPELYRLRNILNGDETHQQDTQESSSAY